MDNLREIYYSIKHNQTRALLSGFGVLWGIFILIILLGTGTGLHRSIVSVFSVFAQKSIHVYGGTTSKKYDNKKEGEIVSYDFQYTNLLKSKFDQIQMLSLEVSNSYQVKNNKYSGNYKVIGVDGDYMKIKILNTKTGGRILNNADIKEERNVVVVGENVIKELFPNVDSVDTKWIEIEGSTFKIIGVLNNDDIFSSADINSVYIPITTYSKEINNEQKYNSFCLTLSSETNSKLFEKELKSYLAHKSQYDINDNQAVYLVNYETQINMFETLFASLRVFIWIIGGCFLISGIIGVSNITFVSVKERTNEIGIRVAIGATPKSIVYLILLEAIILTTIAGVIGLILGKVVLVIVDWFLSLYKDQVMLEKTILDFPVILMALIVIIMSGVVAGLIPAIKASKIEPIDAIRYENRN